MSYRVRTTKSFEKDLKLCKKRGYDLAILKTAVGILAQYGSLPESYRPHKLSGNRVGQWECHLKGDWLLVWEQNDTELVLLFINTGTHSDIF